LPSFILIHPTVLPEYTNVTDKQDRNGQAGQRSDIIGRTVLQTVAQINDKRDFFGDRSFKWGKQQQRVRVLPKGVVME